MSQSGIVRVSSSGLPSNVPTSFTTDLGIAVPVSNNLNVVGGVGIETSAVGDTITITNTAMGSTLTFQTDSGSATPAADIITFDGVNNITFSGTGSTVSASVTGTSNHGVQVGNATGSLTSVGPVASTGAVLMSNGLASDPAFSTATYPITTTINQILYSSAANTVTGLATANRGVLTTGATGIPVVTALATDGQLIIGSTAGAPAAASLTAGAGITITPGSNSITIAATSVGMTWTEVTGATQTLAVANGYITNRGGGVVYTLPATAALGDTIKVVGKAGLATITPNANQQILIGSASGAVGVTGTAVATNAGDCIEIICTTSGASTVWRADSVVGTWILT